MVTLKLSAKVRYGSQARCLPVGSLEGSGFCLSASLQSILAICLRQRGDEENHIFKSPPISVKFMLLLFSFFGEGI